MTDRVTSVAGLACSTSQRSVERPGVFKCKRIALPFLGLIAAALPALAAEPDYRTIRMEIDVAKSAAEGKFHNVYHGFLEARPVTATTSKLFYTLFLDESDKPDAAAKDADVTVRRTRFEGALEKMKEIAEVK